MLSKKLRKLSLREEEKNESKEDNDNKNKDEIGNEEIIIVNMENKSESEEEGEIIQESKSKYLKTKPQPILNVDPNSIQIINYIIDTKPNSNDSSDNYNIQNIMNKYNSKILNYDYKYEDKTYQINDNPRIEEIKDKYQIKDIKKNLLEKEVKPTFRYIPGTYRNNHINNLNNTFNEKNNITKPFYEKNKKQNIYFNYGPIYNYERTKEVKNQIISSGDENGINQINISEYKISNPYNTRNNRTYYFSQKRKNISTDKLINDSKDNSSSLNKTDIRKDYPNLYYFNYYQDFNSVNNNKKELHNRKVYSVEKPNRLRKTPEIKKSNLGKKIDRPSHSFINNDDNKSTSYRINNSMIDRTNDNNNLNNNGYPNAISLRNYNKNINDIQYSYVINDVDNLFQYYPSYNKSNGFSGNTSLSKINYYK